MFKWGLPMFRCCSSTLVDTQKLCSWGKHHFQIITNLYHPLFAMAFIACFVMQYKYKYLCFNIVLLFLARLIFSSHQKLQTPFLVYLLTFSFFSIFVFLTEKEIKMLKKMIQTSKQHSKYWFASQNTQHSYVPFKLHSNEDDYEDQQLHLKIEDLIQICFYNPKNDPQRCVFEKKPHLQGEVAGFVFSKKRTLNAVLGFVFYFKRFFFGKPRVVVEGFGFCL